MERLTNIQKTVGNLGELGQAVFVVNEHSTRADSARNYIQELCKDHPLFSGAIVLATSAALAATVAAVREKTEGNEVNIVIPVGGDTTFNQAATAVEGTNNILCAIRAGNACNAPINLQSSGRRILLPHEVLDNGEVKQIRAVEMFTDEERRIAVTIADIGLISRGARALNTWLRRVPGYGNDYVRNILHERTLLVGHSLLSPSFGITEYFSNNTVEQRQVLGTSVANARRIGHHAVFPQTSLTEPGAFMFELPERSSLWEYSQRIQNKGGRSLDGVLLHTGEQRVLRVDRTVPGSVDGEDFVVEADQQVTYGISPHTINVMALAQGSED